MATTLIEYAVLAGTAVTNTGETIISGGHVGVSPGSTIIGLCADPVPPCPGRILPYGEIHAGDTDAATAQIELTALNNQITNEPVPPGNTLPTDLGETTLSVIPGVYDFTGPNVTINGIFLLNSGDVPNALFIFKIAGTLTTGVGSNVSFDGPPTCTVLWQVGDSATFGSGTVFIGAVLAQNSIISNNNVAVVPGNFWAKTGSVTMDTNFINNISCVPISFFPTPVIDNITAEQTPAGGTILTITGSGLLFPDSIRINGQLVPPDQFRVVNDNLIIITVPPPGLSGIITVEITTPGGQATGQVVIPVPGSVLIACISPHKGSTCGGTVVSIFGLGFTGTISVSFNDTPALSFFLNSDSQITAVSPPHIADNILVTVTTPLGSASFPFRFVRKCDKCGKTICDDRIICDKNKKSKPAKCDKKPKPDKCNKKLEHDIPLVRDKFSKQFKQTKRCVRCNGLN